MDTSSPLHSPHLDEDEDYHRHHPTTSTKKTNEHKKKIKTTNSSKTRQSKGKKDRNEDRNHDDDENEDDNDWLDDDREDLSPLRHISTPNKKNRVYKRQTTPYPEDISNSLVDKESHNSARYRENHENEQITEEDDDEEGNPIPRGKKKKNMMTTSYSLDDVERKVQFQEHEYDRPSTEPVHRKESFKTRKQTPFPHEIEESNRLSEQNTSGRNSQLTADEINTKKKSFQKRKQTPFPHEIEEEIKKAADKKYSTSESISEDQENEIKENEFIFTSQSNDEDRDPEFESYRKEKQNQSNNLFVDLDDEELRPQTRSSPSTSARKDRYLDGSQSAPVTTKYSDSFSHTSSSNHSKSQRNVRLRPLTPEGHFRREYSKDHPLAGGKGKYSRESSQGKEWMGPKALVKHQQPGKHQRISEIVSKQEQKRLDLQRQLEELRKHQNEVLLEVLEEERKAELQRVELSRNVIDHEERKRYRYY